MFAFSETTFVELAAASMRYCRAIATRTTSSGEIM